MPYIRTNTSGIEAGHRPLFEVVFTLPGPLEGASVPLEVSPATTVVSETTFGQATAVGTSVLYARGDHTHGTPVHVPSAAVVAETTFGLASTAGVSLQWSRGDHTHGTPAYTDPVPAHVAAADPHPVYITTAEHDVTARHPAGSVVPVGTPGSSGFGDTAAPGVATTLAAADHRHQREANPVPAHEAAADPHPIYVTIPEHDDTNRHAAGTVIPVANPSASGFGDTIAGGVAAELARADHRHGREADPVPAHVAAADPHTGYQKESEKGAANGYAGLDASALVPTVRLGTGTAAAGVFLSGSREWVAVAVAAHAASHASGGSDPVDASYVSTTSGGTITNATLTVRSPPGPVYPQTIIAGNKITWEKDLTRRYSWVAELPVPGGIDGGLTLWDEFTSKTVASGCSSSAFWDIGPNLRQTSGIGGPSGKHIRVGVSGDASADDVHQIIMKYTDGSPALIQTRFETSTLREVIFESGYQPGADGAVMYLDSRNTSVTPNVPPRLKTNPFTMIMAGAEVISDGMSGTPFGDGNWTDRGHPGGGMYMFYDYSNDIGHLASVRETVAWKKLKYWASEHHFCLNGAATGGGNTGAHLNPNGTWVVDRGGYAGAWDNQHTVFRNYQASPASTGMGFANIAEGHTVIMTVSTGLGVRFNFLNGAASDYVPIAASAFTVSSSADGKSNVANIDSAIAKVRSMRPVKFSRPLPHMADDKPASPVDKRSHDAGFFGLIAEEIANIAPEVIGWREPNPGEAVVPALIDINGVLALAIKALQEVDARVTTLERGRPA